MHAYKNKPNATLGLPLRLGADLRKIQKILFQKSLLISLLLQQSPANI
jgi:hypothetical protein